MKFETHIIDNTGMENKFVADVSAVLSEREKHTAFGEISNEECLERFDMEFIEIGEQAELKFRDASHWGYQMLFPRSERSRIKYEAINFVFEQLQLEDIYQN